MSIDSAWLRCPNCLLPLSVADARALGCPEGHRFDLTKHGTVTLLPPRAPHTIGDSREMLEARRDVLDTGVYAPIAAAIERSAPNAATAISAAARIADLGCGTGYYARRLADARPTTASILLADRSPAAVRMASRAVPGSTGVVLDLWRPLPLRDEVADLVLNVFAPRNAKEFARILSHNGCLIVVVPTPAHLGELRAAAGLLDIPSGKAERVIEQFAAAGLSIRSREGVEYTITADAETRDRLAGMGPSARHTTLVYPAPEESSGPQPLTVSVDVLAFGHSALGSY